MQRKQYASLAAQNVFFIIYPLQQSSLGSEVSTVIENWNAGEARTHFLCTALGFQYMMSV